MEGQDEFIMRKSDNVDVGSGEDYEEALVSFSGRRMQLQCRFVRRQSREHRLAP